ncbi:MAG: response regulator [bacterium]
MVELSSRAPSVLIASHGEWEGRSVESVLALNGFTVLRVDGGRRALELARSTRPDGVILDCSLSDMGGIDVCRALRQDPLFDQSTPIFITAPAPVSNRIRSSAYEAGAWDFCSQPIDIATLLLKFGTFLRARRHAAAQRAEALIDPLTGLYSASAMQQWAQQLGARAARKHEPFACVAVTSSESAPPVTARFSGTSLSLVAEVCLAESRKSDIVGFVGDSRIAIIAPDTDVAGARNFVGRLQRALVNAVPVTQDLPYVPLQAGFFAVDDFRAAGLSAIEVVRRAEAALQFALSGSGSGVARSFDEMPVM